MQRNTLLISQWIDEALFAIYLLSPWLELHQKCPWNKQERQNPSALCYTPSGQKTELFSHAGSKAWENGCCTAASQENCDHLQEQPWIPALLLLGGALGDTGAEKFSLLQGQLFFACPILPSHHFLSLRGKKKWYCFSQFCLGSLQLETCPS